MAIQREQSSRGGTLHLNNTLQGDYPTLKWRLFGTLRGQSAGVPNLLGYPRAKPEQVRASDTLSREIPETPQH